LLAALDGPASEVEQVVALLSAAGCEEPERLGVGDGDRRLLALHRTVTGSELEVLASCPACGELSSAQVVPEQMPPPAPRTALLGSGGGLREPTYEDLLDLPPDPAQAVAELYARCVVGSPARPPGAEDLELVDDSLTGPLVVACSSCGQPIAVDLDIERAVLGRLVWCAHEIDREIHALASAYHWSLAEIESLGDERRRALAELIAEAS
jgi:hypothetical protein